jgi:hypothetical protein
MSVRAMRGEFAEFARYVSRGQSDDVLFDLARALYAETGKYSGSRQTGTVFLAQAFETISRDHFRDAMDVSEAQQLHQAIDQPIFNLFDAIEGADDATILAAMNALAAVLARL